MSVFSVSGFRNIFSSKDFAWQTKNGDLYSFELSPYKLYNKLVFSVPADCYQWENSDHAIGWGLVLGGYVVALYVGWCGNVLTR